MTEPHDYIDMVLPGLSGVDEQLALTEVAEHMSIMGTMIAQTGITLSQVMMTCPKTDEPQEDSAIIDTLRSMTTGADADDMLPVTIACYLGRAIVGDSVLEDRPDIEEVLKTIESWAHGRSYADLRWLLAECVAYATADVQQMTVALVAVRKRLSAL